MKVKKNNKQKITASELRDCWQLIRPWWVSEEKWVARGLFLLVFALDFGIVGIGAWLANWNENFFNAFAAYDINLVWKLLFEALVIAVCTIVAEAMRTWFYQTLQMKWRKWVTDVYLDGWMKDRVFHRIESNHEIDNADQRISEDLKQMVDLTLHLSLGFFANLFKLVTFSIIIWNISGTLSFAIWGIQINIPGYMLWVSIAYALIASIFMEKRGREMVSVEYEQQQKESDFRFMMMRIRENSSEIAISHGEESEKSMLKNYFSRIESNWDFIKRYTRRITVIEKGYTEFGILLAYLLIIPRYFTKQIQIGSIMKLTMSFTNVRVGFAWFIFQYKRLASLRSMCRRLSELYVCINADYDTSIDFTSNKDNCIRVDNLKITLANGTLITKVDYLKVLPGSRWLIKGPSGAGKTTFLKALSGIWQYGTGTISLPDKNLIFLPQMSYLPISNLKSALCYPQSPDEFTNEICIRALRICRLEQYTDALEAEDLTWNKKLSPGEKQRIAFARCILLKPDYLFLDEATSAMDSELEEYIFRTITEELKNTAIVSIAHRESMNIYHDNTLNIISQIDT